MTHVTADGGGIITRLHFCARFISNIFRAHQSDSRRFGWYDIRDKAKAMAAYARQAKDSELIQYATEIKVRAERRCGELLRVTAERGERARAVRAQPARWCDW